MSTTTRNGLIVTAITGCVVLGTLIGVFLAGLVNAPSVTASPAAAPVTAQLCRAGTTVCAPASSPDGAPMVGSVEEDGSARYADGSTKDDHGWTAPVVVRAGVASDAMFDALLELGYVGDPTDGIEALYVTQGDALATCTTAADCELARTPGRII